MSDNDACKKYYGKYRATVLNNVDPLQKGRVQVAVPDVSSILPSTWAMPCLPVGGPQQGMFTVPPIGAGVWIEFEQGDLDYPIWTGVFAGGPTDVPALARMVPPGVFGMTLQTLTQHGIVLSDAPGPTGGLLLKAASGPTITVNDTGIIIQNGQGASITMTGPTVAINGTALVIT